MSLLKICNNCNADQYFYIDNKLEVVFNLTGKDVELNWNIS